jgi:diacylglycerol kinase family enzyme
VSYLAAALKTIMLYYRAPLVRIELDGEIITQPSLMISIMNGRRMGGVTGRARRVVVTALEDALPAHADGETLCTDGQRLSLELQARQIEVVCQAEDDTR